jgi:hypothetical protein
MLLYDDKGNVALDTEEFMRNIKNIQSNELRFGDYLKAYQVEFELEEEIKANLEKGVKQQ